FTFLVYAQPLPTPMPLQDDTIVVDQLTCNGVERRMRNGILEQIVGCLELEAQRVLVERDHARNRRFVIEAAVLACGFDLLVEPLDLALDHERPRRAVLRVGEALERVDEVLCGQLALLSLERRIGREIDAAANLEQIRAAV